MSEGNDDILYSDEEELFNTKNDFNYSDDEIENYQI